MNKLLIICLLLFPVVAYSQQTFKIEDAQTGEPVPFASVIIYHSGDVQGQYTDESGLTKLANALKPDSIVFSCLGYKVKAITSNITDPVTNIQLYPSPTQIKEIEIKPRHEKLIGHTRKSIWDNSNCAPPGEYYTTYVANTGKTQNALIQSVIFRFNYGGCGKISDLADSLTDVFRVHLYNVDIITNKPADEILNDNVLAHITGQTAELIEVDISKYNIAMPRNGIFIGCELIGAFYNKHEIKDREGKSVFYHKVAIYDLLNPVDRVNPLKHKTFSYTKLPIHGFNNWEERNNKIYKFGLKIRY